MSDDGALREDLKQKLHRLTTEVEPRAYSHDEILDVVSRLQKIKDDDYDNKLIVAGFTLHPYGDEDLEQACETRMYYLVHKKFCELPELMLPVEEDWSCRLWRI